MPEDCARIVRALQPLSRDFAGQVRRGRRPSARAVELALEAVRHLKVAYPEHAAEIAHALPWLEAREAKRAA